MLVESQFVYIGDRLWEIAKSLITDYSAEPLSRILPRVTVDKLGPQTGGEILNSLKQKLDERRRKREFT